MIDVGTKFAVMASITLNKTTDQPDCATLCAA